jgi:hypothetical protein
MNREEQIIEASRNPIFKTGLIRIDDISFIAGSKWADKTILQEVLEWLEEITNDGDDGCDSSMVYFTPFDYKEQMLQSFKERFNVE